MIYTILALVFYSIAILFITSATRNANSNLVAALVNVISAIIPIAVVVPVLAKKNFLDHKFGIGMAITAGVFISLFGLALSKALSVNKVGIVTPIIYGGTVLLTTVLSYFLFKEKITFIEGTGLLLVLLGLGVVVYARATV